MSVIHVTSEQDWARHLENTKGFGGKAAVVDFTATWCGPCKMIAPHYEKLAAEIPTVVFLKVDVDELQEVARAAGVTAMPTFQTYFNGQKVDSMTGADPNSLRALVQSVANRVVAGAGRKVGGDSTSAPAPGSAEERRQRMAEAADARAKAAATS